MVQPMWKYERFLNQCKRWSPFVRTIFFVSDHVILFMFDEHFGFLGSFLPCCSRGRPISVDVNCSQPKQSLPQFVLYWQRKLGLLLTQPFLLWLHVPGCIACELRRLQTHISLESKQEWQLALICNKLLRNHLDVVLMCCEWDCDPLCTVQRDS